MSNVVLSERRASASFHIQKNVSDTKTWSEGQRRLQSSGRSSEMKGQPRKAELGPICAKEASDGPFGLLCGENSTISRCRPPTPAFVLPLPKADISTASSCPWASFFWSKAAALSFGCCQFTFHPYYLKATFSLGPGLYLVLLMGDAVRCNTTAMA